jgi:hypothetical protein
MPIKAHVVGQVFGGEKTLLDADHKKMPCWSVLGALLEADWLIHVVGQVDEVVDVAAQMHI